MSMKAVALSWNPIFYGVEIKSAKKHFIVSEMPNMTGRLDAAVKCCETMGIHAASMLAKVSATYSSIVRIHCPGGGTGGSFGWSCLFDENPALREIVS